MTDSGHDAAGRQDLPEDVRPSDVAVVGMACRLPGAESIDEYWSNLRDGVESVRTLSEEELEEAGTPAEVLEDPDHVPREGVLEDAGRFDAGFFGLSPRDASIMDPQHRQFLECTWEALEGAGHLPEAFDGSVGVFAGSGMQAYLIHNLITNPSLMDASGLFLVRHTGNDKDFLATRASYEFDLRGPSVNVQTACSTSLVAVHMACESLLGGECDMALAGGVTIDIPQKQGYLYREGAIFSPDGHCRAFDADASGTVSGSGIGVVALRRLEDALADGDHVHAVIRGSAVNNDGAGKVGFLAPSVDGQAQAVAEALAVAEVEPSSIGYVEAHGTATQMGDPIEVAALSRAFLNGTDERQYCGLGSVKTNIGHLDAAAGVAAFIKTVLALEHGEVPPSLHFREPNPEIDFEDSPFYVNAELREWNREDGPRRAGVNSLGVGGTNAHVVLQEAPERQRTDQDRGPQLLTMSARSPEALDRATGRLADHLEHHPEQRLSDVAWTLQTGRRRFRCRRTLVADGREEAAAALRGDEDAIMADREERSDARAVAWMFPGQGAQYPNMGADLYRREPVFRDTVDRCAELLEPELGVDIREALFPADEDEGTSAERLRHTAVTQPAVFTVEYALADLWRSFGLEPTAMIGHSLGEYTAACRAGVFGLEEGLRLMAARGRLMGELPGGAMLAVPLPGEELAARLEDEEDVHLSLVNASDLSVASGTEEAIGRLEERLEAEGLSGGRLHTSHAFHSPMMDPAVERLEDELSRVDLQPPSIPVISNVSGDWLTPEEATDPAYWSRQMREPVLFAEGVGRLMQTTGAALLEVGPGTTLTSLARRHPARGNGRPMEATLPHPEDDVPEEAFLLSAVGGLWRSGVELDWRGVHRHERRKRVPLPTYPFERDRYWIEPGQIRHAHEDGEVALFWEGKEDGPDTVFRREDVDDWFYRPVWRSTAPPALDEAPEADARPTVLAFTPPGGVGARLVDALEERGCRVVRAAPGPELRETGDGAFELDPTDPEAYVRLLHRLGDEDRYPEHVLHAWSLADAAAEPAALEELDGRLDRSFFSLLHLGQALAEVDRPGEVRVTALSAGTQAADGAPSDPVGAALLGPARVMGRELRGVTCRCVDVDLPARGGWRRDRLVEQLAAEVLGSAPEPVVAYRGPDRLVRGFEATDPSAGLGERDRLREEGVYLITGGLDGLGRVLAEHLAETRRARLALVSRTGLPPREAWDARLAEEGADDPTTEAIRTVRRIEEAGGRVRVIEADVTDPAAMEDAVARAREAFGTIHGAFHLARRRADGSIRLKARETAAAVLAPKIRGTLALDRALRDGVEDFVVLYSSLGPVAGPVGQVDCAAASAFVDAYAAWRSADSDVPVISIGWSTWRDVAAPAPADAAGAAEPTPEVGDGQTDRAADGPAAAATPNGDGPAAGAAHPLLERRTSANGHRVEFVGRLDASRDWVLDEHRTAGGTAVLSGSGLLDLARAAVGTNGAGHTLELRDVLFTAPWTADDGSEGEILISVRRAEDGSDFSIRSPAGEGSDESSWIEHARGTARAAEPGAVREVSLDRIRQRCDREEIVLEGAPLHEGLRLGPRWQNIRRIDLGEDEVLAELDLPEAYRGELEEYPLHPAILDSALGVGQALLSREGDGPRDFFFPVSLDAIRQYAPLAPRMFSHVRSRSGVDTDDPIFDVRVTDPEGRILVEAEGFRMRRAADGGLVAGGSGADGDGGGGGTSGISELSRREGITPAEGMEALEKILSGYPFPHLLVSPEELKGLLRKVRESDLSADRASSEPGTPAGEHDRPSDLSSSYREPRTEMEAAVAAVWREHLGIEGIGVEDDFFELGGHSLLLSQMSAQLKAELGREVSLSGLFDRPTIAGWAEIFAEAEDEPAEEGAGSVTPVSREEVRVDT